VPHLPSRGRNLSTGQLGESGNGRGRPTPAYAGDAEALAPPGPSDLQLVDCEHVERGSADARISRNATYANEASSIMRTVTYRGRFGHNALGANGRGAVRMRQLADR
jgi:hypothetical protein